MNGEYLGVNCQLSIVNDEYTEVEIHYSQLTIHTVPCILLLQKVLKSCSSWGATWESISFCMSLLFLKSIVINPSFSTTLVNSLQW